MPVSYDGNGSVPVSGVLRQRRKNPRVSACDIPGRPKVKGGSPSAVSPSVMSSGSNDSGPKGLKVKEKNFLKSFVFASNLKPQTEEYLRLGENSCAALFRRKTTHFPMEQGLVCIVIPG
jgi:hypothetical protein